MRKLSNTVHHLKLRNTTPKLGIERQLLLWFAIFCVFVIHKMSVEKSWNLPFKLS